MYLEHAFREKKRKGAIVETYYNIINQNFFKWWLRRLNIRAYMGKSYNMRMNGTCWTVEVNTFDWKVQSIFKYKFICLTI